MVGVEVFEKSSFKASSWYGSGRERRGRLKLADARLPYGVVLRCDSDLRGERSSMEGEMLGDLRITEPFARDGCVDGGGKPKDGCGWEGGGNAEYCRVSWGYSALGEPKMELWSESPSFLFFARLR